MLNNKIQSQIIKKKSFLCVGLDIDVNKIILREQNADQDCRGGNTPEVVFAGCSVRDEIFKIYKK